MKQNRVAVLVCLGACLWSHTSSACRYSVRDVGFVDLGAESYRFYGCVSQDTPKEIASAFARMSHAAFADSNVVIEIIDTAKEKAHVAMKYLGLHEAESLPAGVVVSPDGRSLILAIMKPNQPFEETLRSALENIVSSPTRKEILRAITTAYAVIVLIEGEDSQQNMRARKAACGAIERIGNEMRIAPESVVRPPVLIALDPESFSRERTLLWSLGLDADKLSGPVAAVLYGRMRRIGPLMRREEITEANLNSVLSVTGAQCQCGFDISWMQGTMLPVRWDGEMQALAAKCLGFDSENPVVKMEVSGILARGYSYSGTPLGYTELTAEPRPDLETQNKSFAERQHTIRSHSRFGEAAAKLRIPVQSKLTMLRSLHLIAALGALVLIVGLPMFFRAAFRNRGRSTWS